MFLSRHSYIQFKAISMPQMKKFMCVIYTYKRRGKQWAQTSNFLNFMLSTFDFEIHSEKISTDGTQQLENFDRLIDSN